MSFVINPYRYAAAPGGGGITFPITGVTSGYATSTQSPSFTLGTSPVENDVIVAFVSGNTSSGTADVTGWTNVRGTGNVVVQPSDSTLSVSMSYHRVTADEDAADTVTWTLTGLWLVAQTGRISVAVLRGVATSGELVGTGIAVDPANSATPWVIADVTPTASDCQIMAGVGGDNTATQTTPAGHTLQAGDGATQSNYLYSDDTLGVNGVATGTTNVTPSEANEYASITAAFAPA